MNLLLVQGAGSSYATGCFIHFYMFLCNLWNAAVDIASTTTEQQRWNNVVT